jgi:hypothetical protein
VDHVGENERAEHAPPAGHRGLGLIDEFGVLGDGFEEAVCQEDEADDVAGSMTKPTSSRAGGEWSSWRSVRDR